MSGVDRQKVGALVLGIAGIYCVYFVLGVLQEAVYCPCDLDSSPPTRMMTPDNIRSSTSQKLIS